MRGEKLMTLFTKIITAILIIPSLLGIYTGDKKDTEEAYRETIASIAYENTQETAMAQIEIHDIIEEHFSSPLAEGKTEKKAIVIGYDGCRADALTLAQGKDSGIRKMLDNGASLNLVYCGGVNYPEINTQDTSTAPGWCSILTGEWADKTGITGNGITKSMEYKTLLTSLTEEKVIDSASFVTSWNGHFSTDNATYNLEKAYCEENSLDVSFNLCISDTNSANTVIKNLQEDDCSDFIFAIYEGTDHAGHAFGFSTNNPIYQVGFRINDVLAYRTLNAIEERDTYSTEDWLIIITSDHGGFGTGHGDESIQERMTFIVTNK
ncbi:MAG: alkaline phosphatase family protein [Ruminococcaceae bacterium]|nr:alkaline phosphatase family protein [Oscillospiraceae bacterium]